jgi:S1-C subfamily serine protease
MTRYKPGDEVPLEVFRDGKRRRITVKLGERPAETEPRG